MPKTDPQAKQLEEIELLKPHTHAGRDYPVGAHINLTLHGMDLDSAAWLIGVGVAKQVDPILNAAPAAENKEA